MKTIILPTDFSDNAWRAAGYAVSIFRDIPCRYIIFHVFSESGKVFEADIPHVIATKIGGINFEMDKIKKSLEDFDHHPDTTIETSARYGDDGPTIIQKVKNEFADLIVMGRAGATGGEAYGSLTIQILTELPCSVFCIPEKAELSSPEHIMFSTDYHKINSLDHLDLVKDIANQNNSRISIVNIKQDIKIALPIGDAMEGLTLHNFFGEIPHDYYDHEEEEIEEGILNYAYQKNVDLIVLLNRKRKFWEYFFNLSISKAVGVNSNLPILVIHE